MYCFIDPRIDLIIDQNHNNALWDRKGSYTNTIALRTAVKTIVEVIRGVIVFAPFSIPSFLARKRPLLIFCFLR